MQKLFFLSCFFSSSFSAFQVGVPSKLLSNENLKSSELTFHDKCMMASCEVTSTIHGRVNNAKGVVVTLTRKQQKFFGKNKMVVLAFGHQFVGWLV